MDPAGSLWHVALGCLLIGFGMGWVAAPALVVAQSSVAWGERGVATATNMFSRSVGSAIGVAVFGAMVNAVVGDHPTAATAGHRRAPGVRRHPGAGPGDGRARAVHAQAGHPAGLRPGPPRRSPASPSRSSRISRHPRRQRDVPLALDEVRAGARDVRGQPLGVRERHHHVLGALPDGDGHRDVARPRSPTAAASSRSSSCQPAMPWSPARRNVAASVSAISPGQGGPVDRRRQAAQRVGHVGGRRREGAGA